MTLISKRIFLPSKDENIQQFLAKDGAEMRWGSPASKNKANTRARAEGNLIGGSGEKKVKGQTAEPKSPWDDESDALDQGSDNSNSADDTTGKQIKLAVEDAWIEKRGPVDKLTGGRVRFETNPAKKARPENSKPFLGLPGVEMHTTGRAAKLHGALGGKETTPAQKQRMTEGKVKAAGSVQPDQSKAVQDGVWDAWFEKANEIYREPSEGGASMKTPKTRETVNMSDQDMTDAQRNQARVAAEAGKKSVAPWKSKPVN